MVPVEFPDVQTISLFAGQLCRQTGGRIAPWLKEPFRSRFFVDIFMIPFYCYRIANLWNHPTWNCSLFFRSPKEKQTGDAEEVGGLLANACLGGRGDFWFLFPFFPFFFLQQHKKKQTYNKNTKHIPKKNLRKWTTRTDHASHVQWSCGCESWETLVPR